MTQFLSGTKSCHVKNVSHKKVYHLKNVRYFKNVSHKNSASFEKSVLFQQCEFWHGFHTIDICYPSCYKFVHSWEPGEVEEKDGDRRRSRTSIHAGVTLFN